MKTYKIENEEANDRLDKVVIKLEKELSRTAIQRMIENKNILVNNASQKASYKVNIGDIITIEDVKPEEIDIKEQPEIELNIIYEDDDILVINKQKGIVVHPGSGNKDGTLVNAIMAHCKGKLSGIGGKIRPGIVHRIDKDTSGIVIVAKNDKAHINISNQIQKRQVEKEYIALVRGNIKENEATINMPIARSKVDRKKMSVSKDGKDAITNFKVLDRFGEYTLLRIFIETGRTHQIRVHMAEIGHPVVGDVVYSNGKNPFGIIGQMLHARSIQFVHPTTGEEVKFEADIPEYFKKVLEKLKNKK